MLTDKQKLFCREYIKSGNATESYLKAYKCTAKTANSNGCKALNNPNIKAYIDELEKNGGFEDATEKEIRQFFTQTMRNKNSPLHLRMRAAEILGKNFGLTVEQKPQKETVIKVLKDGEIINE